MNKLTLQIITFLIYCCNHVAYMLVTDQQFSKWSILVFTIIFGGLAIAVLVDYLSSQKKKTPLKIHPSTMLTFNIAMWLLNGFYGYAALNLILLAVIFWQEKRLELKEEQ